MAGNLLVRVSQPRERTLHRSDDLRIGDRVRAERCDVFGPSMLLKATTCREVEEQWGCPWWADDGERELEAQWPDR